MAAVSGSPREMDAGSVVAVRPSEAVTTQRNTMPSALALFAATLRVAVPWPAQPEENQVLPPSALPCHR